jgi:sucrose phosphorylase
MLSQKSSQRFGQLLEVLYPGQSLHILPTLNQILSNYQQNKELSLLQTSPFSQKDSLLITYPDMLSSNSDPSPLKILGEFIHKRVAGEFSYLHVLPFFPSSSDEGFSVKDYFVVDPCLGTWDELRHLGKELGLVVDFILNHASAQGQWFQNFLAGIPPFDTFFVTRPQAADVSKVFRPRPHPLLTSCTTDAGEPVWVWTTFSPDQVDLDFSHPAVLLEMVKVLLLYVENGARILRLDAVAFAWKREGTNCLDLPEVHQLVRFFRAVLDEVAPGVRLLSETNLPQAISDSYFGKGDEAQLVYRFALPPLVLHAFLAGRADVLSAWADHLPPPTLGCYHVNFLSSHDGIGLTPARELLSASDFEFLVAESQRRGALVSQRATPEGLRPYELNSTFLDVIAEPLAPDDERVRAFLSAHAVMIVLAGIPAIWFHSLVGSRNWLEGEAQTGAKRSIHRERLNAEKLDQELDDSASVRSRIYRGLLALLRARRERGALDPAAPQTVLSDGGGPLFALLRGTGAASLLTLVNVSRVAANFTLPLAFTPSAPPFDPTDPEGTAKAFTEKFVSVPPQGCVWIDGTWKGA